MIFRNCILKGAHADEPTKATVARIDALVKRERTALQIDYRPVDDPDPDVNVWRARDDDDTMIRLENTTHGRHVTIGSEDAERCARTHRALSAELSFWTVAELLRETKRAKLSETVWLTRLAFSASHAGAPRDGEGEVAELVRARLKSRNHEVRHAAADSTFVLRWPELLPAMIDARKRETRLDTIKMLGSAISEIREQTARKAAP
jgi:hypothetical protein